MSEILTKSSFFQMGRGSSPMVARKTIVLKMGFSRKAAFETRKCRERPTLWQAHTHTRGLEKPFCQRTAVTAAATTAIATTVICDSSIRSDWIKR